jgi:hypothetical protein
LVYSVAIGGKTVLVHLLPQHFQGNGHLAFQETEQSRTVQHPVRMDGGREQVNCERALRPPDDLMQWRFLKELSNLAGNEATTEAAPAFQTFSTLIAIPS